MTVQNATQKTQVTLTAVDQVIPVPFYFILEGDLTVIRRTAAGAETILTLNSDYTVSGAGDAQGGSITMVAETIGNIITVKNDPALTQMIDFVNADDFPAAINEKGLDKLTIIAQLVKEITTRCLQFPISEDTTTSNEIGSATARALKVLGFDASGDISLTTLGSVQISEDSLFVLVDTIAALKALDPDLVNATPDTMVALVKGYYDADDGEGGGVFVLDEGSGATPNDGTVIANAGSGGGNWLRQVPDNLYTPQMFGAKADGSTNDQVAIQACWDYCDELGDCYMPAGTYIVDQQGAEVFCLNPSKAQTGQFRVWGAGIKKTVIQLKSSADLVPAGAAADSTKVYVISNIGEGTLAEKFEMRDLTVNCNAGSQETDASGYVRRSIGGINIHGEGCLFQNVKIQNIGVCNHASAIESFGLLCLPGAEGSVTGGGATSTYDPNVAEGIIVEDWANLSYFGVNGLCTAILMQNNATDGSDSDFSVDGIIRNSIVRCPSTYLPSGSGGRRTYGCTANVVEGCFFENMNQCYHLDSWRMKGIRIMNNTAINCGNLATFNTNGSGVMIAEDGFISDNYLLMHDEYEWLTGANNRGIQIYADPNDLQTHYIKDFMIEGNVMGGKTAGAVEAWGAYIVQGGFLGSDAYLENIVLRNNIISAAATSGWRAIVVSDQIPVADTIQIYGNRNTDGALVTPRTATLGSLVYDFKNYGIYYWLVDSSNEAVRDGTADYASVSDNTPRTQVFHFEEQSNGTQTFTIQLKDDNWATAGDEIALVINKPADNANRTVVRIRYGAAGAILKTIDTASAVIGVWLGVYGTAWAEKDYQTFSANAHRTAHKYVSDSDLFATPEDWGISAEFRGMRVYNLATDQAWVAVVDRDPELDGDSGGEQEEMDAWVLEM